MSDTPLADTREADEETSAAGTAAGARFELLQLERVAADRYRLAVRPDLCSTPLGALYGGIAVAASAEAVEEVVGRPLQWITTQFIGSPRSPDVIDLEVVTMAHGRTTTQAQVVGTVAGRTVFTSLCAHTERDGERVQFVKMPAVPRPDEVSASEDPFAAVPSGAFVDRTERRWAVRPSERGTSSTAGYGALWCRIRGSAVATPASQAFVADIVPLAVCMALGVPAQGTSLDNTIRILDRTPSDWVLLEMFPDGLHRSTGHGSLRIWSDDGRLMGVAQQSAIFRLGRPDPQG